MNSDINNMPTGYHGDFEGDISRHSPFLFRIALRRLRNVEDAEDAVQDALLSAYKHIGQFQSRSQFSTWLTRIVINTAMMKLRARPRHEFISLDRSAENDVATLAQGIVDARPNPEVACARTEMEEKLHQALVGISPKLRIVFQMRELAGMSTRETANALGISVNSLKSRMLRARAAVSLQLDKVYRTRPGIPPLATSRRHTRHATRRAALRSRKDGASQRNLARSFAPSISRVRDNAGLNHSVEGVVSFSVQCPLAPTVAESPLPIVGGILPETTQQIGRREI